MYKRLIGNYWQADEVDMTGDVREFKQLTEKEKDAYLKIIGLLSTLDAPQTRTALLISLYATDPSVQSIMAVIAQQEAVHNESYSYVLRSEEHTSELQSRGHLVCRLLLEKKKQILKKI